MPDALRDRPVANQAGNAQPRGDATQRATGPSGGRRGDCTGVRGILLAPVGTKGSGRPQLQ
eukprot:2932371-Lingulodinium_polyedra.AAC.1